MIRFLVFLAVAFAAAFGFVWLAERPGEVVLTWQGYEIQTSVMAGVVALGAAVLVLMLLLWVVKSVLDIPGRIARAMKGRRRDRGYQALTRGMIAVGSGDVRLARKAAHDARHLLGDESLTLLLSAQSAQIAGDREAARTAFEKLAGNAETRILGLHGLFIEAQRQGETGAALHFAEEAHGLPGDAPWAGLAVFEYRSRSGDWDGALAALAGNESSGAVDKATAKRLRLVLLTGKALELESGSPEDARSAALEANRLDPDFAPTAAIAARLLVRANDVRRAQKVLEAAWRADPHPEIAAAYTDVRPGDAARDRLKRAQSLAAMRPNHREGAIAVAKAAIEAQEWQLARSTLEKLLDDNDATERVFLLMADIEEGEKGDSGRSRSWLARALYAPRDPCWVADGKVYERWGPVSPTTGRIDAFEWTVVDVPEHPPREIDMDPAPALVAPVPGRPAAQPVEDDDAEDLTAPIPDDPGPAALEDDEAPRLRP